MPKPNLKLVLREGKQPFLMQPALALRNVTSRSGKGVYASSDKLYKGAVFGRDSLEVAEDLMRSRPKLVRSILLTLAGLQGVTSNDVNEEERGKILHEYRTLYVDGKPLDDVSKFIFDQLSEKWGHEGDAMTYYGSIDATPHYVRVICEYTRRHGREILKQRVLQRDGIRVSLLASLTSAVDWLQHKLAESSTGLLEYRRRNPHGIENQVWKDSREFYVHENGQLANFHQPIASIEVQALVYDALTMAAEHLPERKADLQILAQQVRDRTIDYLWDTKQHYFSLGIDHDPTNRQLRIIKTTTANPAALLDSGFFDQLSEEARHTYISGIVRNIMGTDFLTDAGIRSRALRESHLISFWDYHGSFTSWPKETYDIAKGLRRQGFPLLAKELENRLLNVVKKSQGYPEFVYVDARGRVLAGSPGGHAHGHLLLVDATNQPEHIQAWTLSATLAILLSRSPRARNVKQPQTPWQHTLEREVLSHIPHVKHLRWPKELNARYPDYKYDIVKNNSNHAGKIVDGLN